MPTRPERRRASIARLDRSRHGTLAIRFHWEGPVWEGVGVPDTPENRAHFQPICDRITDELARGVFDLRRYLYFFPRGNRAERYQATAPAEPAPFLREWADRYLERLRVEGARLGTQATYRRHFDTYILDTRLDDGVCLGNLRLDEIDGARVLQLRTTLLRRLSVNTVRSLISGGFRAAMNEARHVGLITTDPFAGMPRLRAGRQQAPDPFSSEERDQVLAWFAAERPHHWPLILTLFHTGMRPSEAAARRWADFDVRAGTLRIDSSRVFGDEGPPKTAGSNRTIKLVAIVREALAARMPLHPAGDAYVFTAAPGSLEPIDQARMAQVEWATMLRRTKLRARRRALYAPRHTFMSIAVSLGANFLWLATYCGTSARMIERHYARYLDSSGGDQLATLETEAQKSQPARGQVPDKSGGAQ